jgi:hypothetical protein
MGIGRSVTLVAAVDILFSADAPIAASISGMPACTFLLAGMLVLAAGAVSRRTSPNH